MSTRLNAHILLITLFFIFAGNVSGKVKIVVLGSSTAAGGGVTTKANAWVSRYSTYVQKLDASNSVVNLAKGGTVTFNAMPTGYVVPAEYSFVPDTLKNITKALSYKPDAVIINFPSNDISYGISISQQISNYKIMIEEAGKQNVPVWICTSQPVNYGSSQSARDKIKALKDSIENNFGEKSIDFYSGLCDDNGKILSEYDSGDGLHLNDAGHAILFQRVVDKDILSKIISKLNETKEDRLSITISNGKVTVKTRDKFRIDIYDFIGRLKYTYSGSGDNNGTYTFALPVNGLNFISCSTSSEHCSEKVFVTNK